MSCDTNLYGRDLICKNSIIGIRNLYFASYQKLTRSQRTVYNLHLNNLPSILFYKFKATGTFSQSYKFSTEGDSFDLSLNATFNKITEFDTMNFNKFISQDLFIIVEDKMANFYFLGIQNGMRLESMEQGTATQQYAMTFSGKEEKTTPYITSELTIFDGFNTVFLNGDNQILQNNDNLIF